MQPAVTGLGVVNISRCNFRRVKAIMIYEVENLFVQRFSLIQRDRSVLIGIFHESPLNRHGPDIRLQIAGQRLHLQI